MKTLCVTGHRPAKLPWKYKKEGLEYDEYCESLSCYIDDCIRHGYTHFISGMALGVDMDFAETVLDFKAQYGFPILLECAIPCPNQTTIADIKKKRNTAVNVRILFELCQGLGIDIVEFFNSPIFKTENIVD